MSKPLLIAITGPTASGKSALAVELARRLNTEIISADSRQIYKGIPITTAVPTVEERGGIPHHLLEILDLEDYYSASKFEKDSMEVLEAIFKKREMAVVCGGSMLYIDSLLYGIDEIPTVPNEIRNRLTELWQEKGDEWLLERLRTLDPDYYESVDHHNLKRVFHAVEVTLSGSIPYSQYLTNQRKDREFDYLKICLGGERSELFNRINSRVVEMMKKGMEEEARSVYESKHLNSLNTVGFKEMFAWFEGKMTKDEAISRIQKNTRVYAKKQLTWHQRDKNSIWLDFQKSADINSETIIGLALQKIQKS